MLKKIIRMADRLDKLGLFIEASILDVIIKKLAANGVSLTTEEGKWVPAVSAELASLNGLLPRVYKMGLSIKDEIDMSLKSAKEILAKVKGQKDEHGFVAKLTEAVANFDKMMPTLAKLEETERKLDLLSKGNHLASEEAGKWLEALEKLVASRLNEKGTGELYKRISEKIKVVKQTRKELLNK